MVEKNKLKVDEEVEKSELTKIMINIQLLTDSLFSPLVSARRVLMDMQFTSQLSQRYLHLKIANFQYL